MTGTQFRQFREQYGLAAESVARLLGVHVVTVQNWEQDRQLLAKRHHDRIDRLVDDVVGLQARNPTARHTTLGVLAVERTERSAI